MAEKRSAPKREAKAPRGPFTITTAWAAAILALLTVLFFHEVTLGGRTFVSSDAVQPAGFVRMGEQSLWQDKVYPLWNPYVFLGMPSFGSGAYNPLIYPPDWPLALIGKVLPMPDMTWLLLYYFLGGLFAFLLAREWGARPEGALLGAAAFVFQPNLVAVGSHGHGSQLVNSAYLPLLLWLAVRWLRRGNLADLGFLALAGGFQFLRGHIQICLYSWMAVAIWAGVDLLATLRKPAELPAKAARLAGLAVAAALAFGVAGFYNLPLRDYSQYSIRGGGADGGTGFTYATGWSMAPYELIACIIPNGVGFGGATYWGGMPFTDYPNAYLGIVTVLLAIPACLMGGAPRVFALALGLFSLLVSFGSHFPLYGFLYEHFPQFNKFRIPVMIIILFQLAAALAAAWGWTELLERGATRSHAKGRPPAGPLERVIVGCGAVLLLAGLVALVGGEGLRGAYVSFATGVKQGFSPEAANAAYAAFAGDLGRVAFTGLVVVGLSWFVARGALTSALGSLCVLVVLLFDIWPVSGRVMQPTIGEVTSRTLDFGRDDVVEFLEKAGPRGSFRVLPTDGQAFQDNRLAGFGIATLGGYHAAKPRLFQDLLDSGALQSFRWLALLNVRYLTAAQPLQLPPFLTEVFRGSGVVYQNALVLPRATMVGAYGVLPDTGRAAIDSVAAGTHDPSRFTWLVKDPGVTLGNVDSARVEITAYDLHTVKLAVETPAAGILRLADLYYPDWRVRIDGKPAELLRADHLLRAVVVPAGTHEVEFHFESQPVRDGLRLSIGSIVAALALLAVGALRSRRRPTAEDAISATGS